MTRVNALRRDIAAVAACANARANPQTRRERTAIEINARRRRRPANWVEGFTRRKGGRRAMHTAVRKESLPRRGRSEEQTDWSHAKIKSARGTRRRFRCAARRPPPSPRRPRGRRETGRRCGTATRCVGPPTRAPMATLRRYDQGPSRREGPRSRAVHGHRRPRRAVRDKIRKCRQRLRRVVSRGAEIKLRGATLAARPLMKRRTGRALLPGRRRPRSQHRRRGRRRHHRC